jgi:hypothetical protein
LYFLQLLSAADESAALKEAGDVIMSTYATDPIRLNFELLYLCKSIVSSNGEEDWDSVADRIISRVQSTVQERQDFPAGNDHHSGISNEHQVQSQGGHSSLQSTCARAVSGQGITHPKYKSVNQSPSQDGWISTFFSMFRSPIPAEKSRRGIVSRKHVPDAVLVKQLVDIGFSQAESEEALSRANNDQAAAVAHLTQPKAPSVDPALAVQLRSLGFAVQQV